jgi:hypothetical protein
MRIVHSIGFAVVLVLSLVSFTACGKVHPAPRTADSTSSASEPNTPAPGANKPAANPKSGKEVIPDLNPLNLEVTALEMLSQFKMTRPQLERLAKLAPVTSGKSSVPRPRKVSDDYKKVLKDLREALLDNNEVRISDLSAALDELREKESPDFDEVEITDAARRNTAEVLRSLSARQVVGYLTDFADEFPDPREKLTDAFEQIRKLPVKEWEALRDEVAGQVGWLMAGLDTTAENRVHDRVSELLNRVHRQKDEEYTSQRAELDRAVQSIVGDVGPTKVVDHFVERSLAELLSNPCLSKAIEARLKKAE